MIAEKLSPFWFGIDAIVITCGAEWLRLINNKLQLYDNNIIIYNTNNNTNNDQWNQNQTAHAHTTELQLCACVCGDSPMKKIWAIYPKTFGAFHEKL